MSQKAQRIEELEAKRAQLIETNKEIETLKQAIATFQARQEQQRRVELAPHGNVGLPQPALMLICEYFIAQNSTGIRSIFLVCKGWNKVIRESPYLWSNVRITAPAEAKYINKITQYCEACIKNSSDLPLDVWIDYTPACIPLEVAIYEHLLEPLSKMNEDAKFQQDLKRWLWRRCRSDSKPIAQEYKQHYLKPIKALVGKDGEGMRRWRGFEFYYKQTKTSVFTFLPVQTMFCHPTPILETLIIENDNPRSVLAVYDKIHAVDSNNEGDGDPGPFPSLPQLQELQLKNAHLSPAIRNVEESKLRVLQLPWFSDVYIFAFALRCSNLTELCIRLDANVSKESIIDLVGFQKNRYIFPFLIDLQVGGDIPSEFWTTVEFPALRTLTFGDYLPLASLALPGAWSLSLVDAIILDCRTIAATSLSEGVFEAFIVNCPSLRIFEAPEKYESDIVSILRALKNRNVYSPVLHSLRLRPKKGEPSNRHVDLAFLRDEDDSGIKEVAAA